MIMMGMRVSDRILENFERKIEREKIAPVFWEFDGDRNEVVYVKESVLNWEFGNDVRHQHHLG